MQRAVRNDSRERWLRWVCTAGCFSVRPSRVRPAYLNLGLASNGKHEMRNRRPIARDSQILAMCAVCYAGSVAKRQRSEYALLLWRRLLRRCWRRRLCGRRLILIRRRSRGLTRSWRGLNWYLSWRCGRSRLPGRCGFLRLLEHRACGGDCFRRRALHGKGE